MTNLFGLDVLSSPLITPVPKIQLREHVPVSPEFRAQMNAWLLETFGTKRVAYMIDNSILGGLGQTFVMHPDDLRRFKS